MQKVVTVIPVSEKNGCESSEKQTLRVAAYARVSSLPQEESYDAQVAHFQSLISSHPGWELTKVYGDEGISGLNTKKRTGFRQMIKDGVNKKYDLLLVKSISRMGRNTVDLLTAIRELKAVGTAVFYEKENINTLEATGEMLITLLSAFAQSESESISGNVRISLQYKMARGEHSLAYSNFLGYDKGEEGKLVINPEQAKTVKYIFDQFLSGVSLERLSRELKDKGYTTGTGGNAWTKTALKRILSNEKYAGCALLAKTTTVDVLNKKRAINDGIVQQYWVEKDHDPIVDKQTWLIAKGELMRREEQFMGTDVGGPEVYCGKHDFTRKIRCPDCGAWYNHKNAKTRMVWVCHERMNSKGCKGEIIPETDLQNAVLSAAQKLYDKQPEISMKKVPSLTHTDDDEKLIRAAAVYAENTFGQRIVRFLKGARPTKYTSDLIRLLERIEIKPESFEVHFYGKQTVLVPRQGGRNETGRRLKRS